MQKQTLILTTMLFLMFAPVPDSRDIAEMSTNFLVLPNHSVLMAADNTVRNNMEEHSN